MSFLIEAKLTSLLRFFLIFFGTNVKLGSHHVHEKCKTYRLFENLVIKTNKCKF